MKNLTQLTLLFCSMILFISYSNAQDTLKIERNGKTEKVIIYDTKIEEEVEEEMKELEEEMRELEIELEEEFSEEEIMEYSNEEEEKKDNVDTRWFLFEFGFTNVLGGDDVPEINGENPSKVKVWPSFNLGVDVFQIRFNLIKHYLNFKTGIKTDFNWYHFDNDYAPLDRSPELVWSDYSEYGVDNDLDKNRLYTWNGSIPLLLNIETNPDDPNKSFHINLGGYVGLLFNSDMLHEFSNKELRTDDDFNLTRFNYGLRASVGYDSYNLYFNYGLNDLFKEDENSGYALTPVSFGLQISPF